MKADEHGVPHAKGGNMKGKMVEPFMTLIGIESVDWDALEQVILVQARAAQRGAAGREMCLALTPETAESLLRALSTCVLEKGSEAGPMQ
jgi:hypothetical protein